MYWERVFLWTGVKATLYLRAFVYECFGAGCGGSNALWDGRQFAIPICAHTPWVWLQSDKLKYGLSVLGFVTSSIKNVPNISTPVFVFPTQAFQCFHHELYSQVFVYTKKSL